MGDNPTVTHPTATVAARVEPRRDRHYTPQESVRYRVAVEPESAPKPVDYTQFWDEGLTFEHAWPHEWRYNALAIADKLAVASYFFQVPKVPSALVVGMPAGSHHPIKERSNIEQNPQTSYGNIAAVKAGLTVDPTLAKLI